MCVLSIKVLIRKKSGNLFNEPRTLFSHLEFCILCVSITSTPTHTHKLRKRERETETETETERNTSHILNSHQCGVLNLVRCQWYLHLTNVLLFLIRSNDLKAEASFRLEDVGDR